MSVTELKFLNPSEIPHSLFVPPVREARAESPMQLTKQQAQSKWSLKLPNALPFGFVLERVEEMALPKNLRTLHAVYTDGLTKVSLFLLPPDLKFSFGSSRVSVIKKSLGRRILLLVSSIDKALLSQIAKSF